MERYTAGLAVATAPSLAEVGPGGSGQTRSLHSKSSPPPGSATGAELSIIHLTYSYVSPGVAASPCSLRTPSSELAEYLEDHITSLVAGAGSRKSPPAEFLTQDARERFLLLETGTTEEFITGAQQLLDRLMANMDARSKPGFFVAVRRQDGRFLQAAVLKLDVSDKAAAAVRDVASGDPTLEAFKGLLDTPGSLQKGAIHPDPRPYDESELVVGDRQLSEAALFFLRTIDVRQNADPGQATVQVIRAVYEIAPEKAPGVAAALVATTTQVAPIDFFDDNPDLLDTEEREKVVGRLTTGQRPVRDIDPTRHALQVELTADGILVRVRAEDIDRKVDVRPRQGGGWTIEIEVEEEPRRRYL
ncbi:MAG: hypothetical protein QOG44_3833 [Acidimicrobiaceae bacterium]|nr:hypothetical protein [Acidimicrobiaceae bacterium]